MKLSILSEVGPVSPIMPVGDRPPGGGSRRYITKILKTHTDPIIKNQSPTGFHDVDEFGSNWIAAFIIRLNDGSSAYVRLDDSGNVSHCLWVDRAGNKRNFNSLETLNWALFSGPPAYKPAYKLQDSQTHPFTEDDFKEFREAVS